MRRICMFGVVGLAATGVLVAFLAVAGCGSEDSSTATPGEPAEPTSSVSANSTETAVEPLVGEWQRETTCAELVQALKDAGFDQEAVQAGAGNGFIPGVTSIDQLADAAQHPCEGAVPRKHSHFFTSEGLFGSRDWNGQQVDEGTYEIIDNDTLVIPYGFEQGEPVRAKFHYRIHGDTLILDPVLPSNCSTGRCREVASWAVSVAYPGEVWERVG